MEKRTMNFNNSYVILDSNSISAYGDHGFNYKFRSPVIERFSLIKPGQGSGAIDNAIKSIKEDSLSPVFRGNTYFFNSEIVLALEYMAYKYAKEGNLSMAKMFLNYVNSIIYTHDIYLKYDRKHNKLTSYALDMLMHVHMVIDTLIYNM